MSEQHVTFYIPKHTLLIKSDLAEPREDVAARRVVLSAEQARAELAYGGGTGFFGLTPGLGRKF